MHVCMRAVSEHIECGSCLAGGVREMVIEVENTGGEGRFSLSLSDSQQHQVCNVCWVRVPLCMSSTSRSVH